MSQYIVKAKKTYLKSPLSTSATQVVLRYLKDSKDNNLSLADFGAWGVIVIKQGDTIEMIKFDAVAIDGTTGVATLDVATNGRNLDPTTPYAGSSTGNAFQSGAEVIVTNDPLTVMQFGNLNNAQTWALQQTFTLAPISSADAVASNELIRKSQLDSAVLGSLTITPVVVEATGGETLAVDTLVYQKDSDGEWYKCDADTASTVDNVRLGITRGAGTDGGAITNGVTVLGTHEASSALFTANTKYYASNTAGAFSSSAGTNEVSVGYAISTTKIILYPRFDQQLTEKQQDILALIEAGNEFYGASSGGTDTYAVTLDPAPTAYANGMRIRFKADVANTGACSLNVNGLGAIAIKSKHDQDPSDGEIEANQIVEVIYNSTTPSFQIVSQSSLLTGSQVDVYTSNDTWTKPTGAKSVTVIVIGAGGGGGSGASGSGSNTERGGSGGGGGAMNRGSFHASLLGSTVAITVGVGGTGGASVTGSGTTGNDGTNGGLSSFGNFLKAGGGGKGLGGSASSATVAGGGGGGVLTSASGATAGTPASASDGLSGQGVAGGTSTSKVAEYGGGAGGGGGASLAGGSSIYGGGGGGGGTSTNGTGTTTGNAGGTCGSYSVGGGGAGGVSGGNGTAGSNASVLLTGHCGSGGGSGGANGSGNAGNGGAGGFPAGGGGGGGCTYPSYNSGAGGAGANGQVIVITYF